LKGRRRRRIGGRSGGGEGGGRDEYDDPEAWAPPAGEWGKVKPKRQHLTALVFILFRIPALKGEVLETI